MTEEERILQLLYRFEETGLISLNTDDALDCIADRILGMGIGEQGFVTSKEDVKTICETTRKTGQPNSHTIRYGRTEILLHSDSFATVCAEITVLPKTVSGSPVMESRFLQMLTMIKERGEWKICALHASTPIVTEETIEAYPLKFAEKTLQNLKERIGEQVYNAEEQYRQAILSDTIAFYILNITQDIFEKCQCNSSLCADVEAGTPYSQYLKGHYTDYLFPEDQQTFLQIFSKDAILAAFADGQTEISLEYRLKTEDGGFIWVVTDLRLITDIETGDHKGIMYVRDINHDKLEEQELMTKATVDGMTKLYHKTSLIQAMELHLNNTKGVFLMFDVDDFKTVNDTWGHPIGDIVLIQIAGLLKEAFGEFGIVGRLGGDEFGIFLPAGEITDAFTRQLSHLKQQVEDIRIEEAPAIRLSCSIGVTACDAHTTFEENYKKADAAMYASKRNGKNKITFSANTR